MSSHFSLLTHYKKKFVWKNIFFSTWNSDSLKTKLRNYVAYITVYVSQKILHNFWTSIDIFLISSNSSEFVRKFLNIPSTFWNLFNFLKFFGIHLYSLKSHKIFWKAFKFVQVLRDPCTYYSKSPEMLEIFETFQNPLTIFEFLKT